MTTDRPVDDARHVAALSRPVSRRTFAKAAAAGIAIVGFQGAAGRWVSDTEPVSPATPFAGLPRLDGTLTFDPTATESYAQDFGQIISERPAAVLRPGSIEDVSRMLRFARRHDIRVVNRGKAHTTFGQSQHRAGIVFDLTTFDRIGPVRANRVRVGAGCRWTDVLQRTLANGLMPTVLPDFIGQTVGGTLSVGGIGAMSFRAGAQIDHVLRLTAVTGNGDIVDCSPHEHPELFEMLLAGQGQVGVIIETTLELVAAPSTVRVYDLVYPDLDTMLADLAALIRDRRFDQMEAFVIPTGPGTWVYLLEALGFHTAGGPPDDDRLQAGLHVVPGQTAITDLPFVDWSNRVQPGPTRPHPWIDLMLPMSHASTFVSEVQSSITPVADGDQFNLLLIPLRSSTFTRPLFRSPTEDLVVGFDTLRSVPAGVDIEALLAYNRRLFDRAIELGGTQYPISAVRLDPDDWACHYGDQFGRLLRAKRTFDRDNVLASGPDVLGRWIGHR
jgi:cytokinin dehydrogenase